MLEHHQSLVLDAGVDDRVDKLRVRPLAAFRWLLERVAHCPDEAFARGHPLEDPLIRPVRISSPHDVAHAASRYSLPAVGRLADQYGKQVQAVPIALDEKVRNPADRIAQHHEKLD